MYFKNKLLSFVILCWHDFSYSKTRGKNVKKWSTIPRVSSNLTIFFKENAHNFERVCICKKLYICFSLFKKVSQKIRLAKPLSIGNE